MPTVQLAMPTHSARLERGAWLPGLLHRQAHMRPDAVAVVCGELQLTFRELDDASGRLGAYLRRAGLVADDCVGLYTEPSMDLMVGAWGILRAGAAYLPLSPDYPDDRLRYMIEDSRTRVIITQAHLKDRLAELVPHGTRILVVEEARDRADAVPDTPRPESLAYVIYTSGSTGKPKGVMIEHHSIMSQMRWMQDCGHLGATVTVLQKTPMSFDAAQWEILAPAAGARVVMGEPGIHRDPDALIAAVKKHGVTTLQGVPTLLQALLDTEELGTCVTLKRVFSGGEALSQLLARALLGELPEASLINLYGPTECTINATACLVDPEMLHDSGGAVPIGVPADNTQCFILDKDLAPVGIGTTGELYIGGVQLARGYLHRPEQTKKRFIASPFVPTERVYRTGDLAYWNPNGTISYVGRADTQVKLRGYRVELDEISLAIEEHTWVRRAATMVIDDLRTGFQNLVACVELNPKEATLMDQGSHGGHHQSKKSKLQVKAQLSDPGLRSAEELRGRPAVVLPGARETQRQRDQVFARKTYRFYEGGRVTRADILALLTPRAPTGVSRGLEDFTFDELGSLLRGFGQFHSAERLLPKYAYASPGALYATQLYLEASGLDGLDPGAYYYHPVHHSLVRVSDAEDLGIPSLRVHFVGKKRAVEPVYVNNIREVLEFEAGHMVGVFEEMLPAWGLRIRPQGFHPAVKGRLDVADSDYYLGTFEIGRDDGAPPADPTEIFVQAHPGRVEALPAGHYRFAGGELEHISDARILAKHVIAINQQAYDRAAFGITAVSRAEQPWLAYISMGTKLHHLQSNGLSLGLMSSGYSSESGHPLPAARRMDDILMSAGIPTGPSYFSVGGKVSDSQLRSEGMREDAVHMKGPAEIIKDEIAHSLPDYMIPNRLIVMDGLPLTVNGKVDVRALAASEGVRAGRRTPYVAPTTRHQRWLADSWRTLLKYEDVSAEDDFFEAGGNSLTAVALVNRANREFGVRLPLQVVFEYPRLADLAARIESGPGETTSRLVLLHDDGPDRPVFCWPGLGGYPMNLRPLAQEAGLSRPFYGIQAQGINAGEVPFPTVQDMAAADVAEIRRKQPAGPYTLWGYSFGARVAFEAAWQLEQLGEKVENLFLICPGNPELRTVDAERHGREASYANPAYVTILLSVFTGSIDGHEMAECLAAARDEESFVSFVCGLIPVLDKQLVRRIIRVVSETYEFEYAFRELSERRLNAPVTLFKATGDDYSFIEGRSGYSTAPVSVVSLDGDHYGVLKKHGVSELVSAIRTHLAR
ncbi:amino acid adenylation domain-containing protein [Streptomyces sp. NPDC048445]|uniref:non-ribosomal peptide synthetase family protein n=1 Tax=Streptomyces sp. NPDC048445 TaxID=3365553 RepID=UPI0037111240